MKSPLQANAKWKNNTTQATQTWLANLQGTTKPIVAAAVAQTQNAVNNYSESLTSGRWARALEAVGDAGIKAAAAAKQANFGTGVNAAGEKQLAVITKIMNYESQGLPAIYGMPKGNTAAGIARASAWITYMAAGKGSFK